MTAAAAEEALVAAAERFLALRADATVIMVVGWVEVFRPGRQPRPAPQGVSAYDAAILAALTERPQSARRLAALAGHRFNSYFRSRLSRSVDAGLARHLSRGYALP